jgi:hypothetical protein
MGVDEFLLLERLTFPCPYVKEISKTPVVHLALRNWRLNPALDMRNVKQTFHLKHITASLHSVKRGARTSFLHTTMASSTSTGCTPAAPHQALKATQFSRACGVLAEA